MRASVGVLLLMVNLVCGRSDSILEMIDRDAVERLMVVRRLDPNRLDDDEEPAEPMRRNASLDRSLFRGGRLLKSSRSALVVTRKEYLRRDWCKTEPLLQRVKEEGCLTRTVVNRFCYGQCNSFYIPRGSKHQGGRDAFRSCAFCKPKQTTWVAVTLRCPALRPQLRRKRFLRIRQCKCIAQLLN